VSRRFALVAAVAAALLVPGAASAATATVTVSGSTNAFASNSPTLALGGTVEWQAIATTRAHTATADKFSLFNFPLPAGSETSPSVQFDRAGGFGFHCAIHGSMRGTVNVQMSVTNSGPAVGQMVTITFAMSAAPSGFSEQIQKRKAGGTWKNFSVGNTGTSVNFTPPRAKTFQFRARLVQGGVFTSWSPILNVVAH
jgi:plastocyanin